jgi:hypothetical protein
MGFQLVEPQFIWKKNIYYYKATSHHPSNKCLANRMDGGIGVSIPARLI